ncbi:class I SAM-dependent methyltransferase [Bryobacter aggregatus]|uniref:class I SAM-dependent methyltransferase n=1 Tax=Bryobacter aggregatus TaxID=360054 RepID=UPI0004E1AC9E|nr:class I SAM-dependent methyltransferase [Bryobacter aggregatus]
MPIAENQLPLPAQKCPTLREIYLTDIVTDHAGQQRNPFPTSTPPEISAHLYDKIVGSERRRTIEIGMAYGLSTLSILQAHCDNGGGTHIALDPGQDHRWGNIGLLNVERSGLGKNFRFFEQASHVALPALLAEKQIFDFAFIDGCHLFDYALLDFFYIDKMMEVGGLIMIDDVWMPAVRKLISFILRNQNYRMVPYESKPGFGSPIKRIAGRLRRSPREGFHLQTMLLPSNICLLEKTSVELRPWDFHQSF